mmetsp:Transcript_4885/g.7904  ORF Transcript_4885/g.7904 Transcript_4885/m.7904 type:complete len:208 (+) Transcript_4885:214-837(+)
MEWKSRGRYCFFLTSNGSFARRSRRIIPSFLHCTRIVDGRMVCVLLLWLWLSNILLAVSDLHSLDETQCQGFETSTTSFPSGIIVIVIVRRRHTSTAAGYTPRPSNDFLRNRTQHHPRRMRHIVPILRLLCQFVPFHRQVFQLEFKLTFVLHPFFLLLFVMLLPFLVGLVGFLDDPVVVGTLGFSCCCCCCCLCCAEFAFEDLLLSG